MKFYENCIELSDRHVLWDIHNASIKEEDFEPYYQYLVDVCSNEFRDIYGCDFYMLGRSGRHICVEDTPANRQSYCRMKRTVERLQNWMIETYNKAIW